MSAALSRLAQAHGIGPAYHDIWGVLHETRGDTMRSLLAAMGVDATTDESAEAALAAHERALWRSRIAPMVVLRDDRTRSHMRVHLPAAVDLSSLRASIVTEKGDRVEAAAAFSIPIGESIVDGEPWRMHDVAVALTLSPGYHRLAFLSGEDTVAETLCAIAPRTCHRPAALSDGLRAWGTAVQLYGLRSDRNWGIGDFTDLGDVVVRCGRQGAGIVGVNPLHALFPHDPARVSPYSPSSRLFANTLYLDIEAIADVPESNAACARLADAAFRSRLAGLRGSALVDYPGVASAKHEILEMLFASFRERHLDRGTHRADRFRAFLREGGEALRRHALFEALQEHFHAADAAAWGWPAWPRRYRDPESPEVARFALDHSPRVDYFAYLQWQADLQRAAIAQRAADAGLAVGLYTDLAVSVDRGGAESWGNQQLYATVASVGAPPDDFSPGGQDWGLPPLVPSRLRSAAYAPFIATLRANMRHAGALRIDHVMGLMRLFWIPQGRTPAEGAYVHYPFEDLVGLLALESHRHRCAIIGEDLGTVPDEVRRTLEDRDVLSYRVLLFERDDASEFKPPDAYPEAALATASTHDLPTLAGWWEGRDIDVRAGLGLIGDQRGRLHEERSQDRQRLLRALLRAGLLPNDASADPASVPVMTEWLAVSIAAFLGSTRSRFVVLQLEDLFCVREQANVPGTTDQHPNWRRKLPVSLEGFDGEPFAALAARLSQARLAASKVS